MAPTKPAPQVDYTALLGSDPVLQAALGQITTRGVQQQLGLTAARQQALIGYGAVPDTLTSDPRVAGLVGNIAPDITDETRGLARQADESGLSTTSQISRDFRRRGSAEVGSLIGRGMLRSGDYRRLAQERVQDEQVARSNALTGLLGTLGGAWQGFQGQQQQNAADVAGATNDAADRIYQQINAGLLGAGAAAPAATAAPAAGSASPPPRPRTPGSVPVTVGAASSMEPKPQAANLATAIGQPRRRKPAVPSLGFRALA